MLATFVIGLREGLEAALIVGIIAAFLRKNGKSLTAMWAGVGLAVLLSLAVGVGLDLVEQALPQAEQEAMETIIGTIAIFFVTGMIVWMNAHARDMKHALESQAAAALSRTSSLALAVMAFLAVLREGFETSVFLLATFSAAQSAALAATGAVLGILLAVAIGWGIYIGGVKVNLARFFRVTGAFLILVAAGLAISALRTAHEAGWLNAGQQATVNLAWLVAPGTIQSALITGVLGIPADPRAIEVIGWLAYLVPVALFIYWPESRRPSARGVIRLQAGIGLALAVLAACLAIFVPASRLDLPAQAPVIAGSDSTARTMGTARLRTGTDGVPVALDLSLENARGTSLTLADGQAQQDEHDGIPTKVWRLDHSLGPSSAPSTLTLDQVVDLAGGRIPVGLNPQQNPGPYDVAWNVRSLTTIWIADGALVDAAERKATVVTLSGGGLKRPRVLSVSGSAAAPSAGWQVAPAYREQAIAALDAVAATRAERNFWAVQLPILLAVAAFTMAAVALRGLFRLRRGPMPAIRPSTPSVGKSAARFAQGATHAVD